VKNKIRPDIDGGVSVVIGAREETFYKQFNKKAGNLVVETQKTKNKTYISCTVFVKGNL
jgi:hypothetical protein